MKTATIPAIRVEPEFRAEIEASLSEDETVSQFVEKSVRDQIERRRLQSEFIARGLRSRDDAQRSGVYVDAEVVLGKLERKLEAARAQLKTRK
ncbi:MAG TPA: YlcI/YnfO family protein [Roseateles sp.]